MKNVLIISGAKEFAHSKGELNTTLVGLANDLFMKNDMNVKVTHVDKGYNISEEIEKILWADVVIYQMPVWWMGAPWIIKKYIDNVFTEGHQKVYANDGRSIDDPSKKYGSGGLLNGKKFMLSVTWNAPLKAFTDSNQFFEGKGVDAVFFPLRKANEFLGMEALPTFMCNDVMKNPDFNKYVKEFTDHIKTNIIDKK